MQPHAILESERLAASRVANDTNPALSALRNSLAARRARPGLVHHTDRRSPYAIAEYRQRLEQHGAVASMSRPPNCWDNAVAESFFSTLTADFLRGRRFASPEQAAVEIADNIEGFYNLTRRHSTIGYVSPIEHELRHHAVAEAASLTCLRTSVTAIRQFVTTRRGPSVNLSFRILHGCSC